MRRVLVIGSSGSGKSTLSRQIGARLGLPVVHLDQHYWSAGWVEPSPEAWAETVGRLAAAEAWVMDGNYSGTMSRRLAAADAVVFLDRSRWLCVARVGWRRVRHAGRSRPDMAEGCPEQITASLLRFVWTYPGTRRPAVLARLGAAEHLDVFHLRSGRDVQAFLASLPPRGETPRGR